MNASDREEFIRRMEEVGDVWEDADVERVYGDRSLEEALEDRMGDMGWFAGIISTIINGGK